jgi:cyclophilin family peptidyl-prolyl cis-trans isomerase/HEAT repeat protein
MTRRLSVAIVLCLAAASLAADSKSVPAPQLPPALTKVLDPVIDALFSRFDLKAAQGHVRFVTQYWRLPGNTGYDATIDRVHARLAASGFHERTATDGHAGPEVFVEEYPNSGRGWEHSIGTLAIVHTGRPDEVVLSKAKERLALCINSFSTAPGGVTAKLVDVGRGDQDSDYTNRDVTGAVIVGDADAGQLWRRGVMAHGAMGVISGAIGQYVNPDPPGAKPTPRETWNILQWGSIPYDEAKKGFGFKATPHAMTTLRHALNAGAVIVRVTIASTFSTKPARTLVAEIPGRDAPNERVVLAVHVQEPGANDNASGVATLAEVARALSLGIQQGKIPPPSRTLTMLWLDEIGGSRQWLTSHADAAKSVKYMFSMDMTGEDVKKTGGSFLIERWPDPGAVWERPWDPHTEWGQGNVRADRLKGDLLNDLHLAVCLRVARKTGWVVKTNPYEGGSDHTVFGTAGIPSVLDWHFTDRYYHTNLDTADKSSAPEMRNVGVSAVSTAWLLASAKEPAALAVAELVAKAGRTRVAFEEREGAHLAAAEANQAAARLKEDQIVTAWKQWYAEAVASVSRLVLGQPSPAFRPKLEQLAAPFTGVVTRPAALEGYQIVPASYTFTREAQGTLTVQSVQLALDRLLADRWYPPAARKSMGIVTDEAAMKAAFASDDPAIRRVVVRGLGQFENPLDVPVLEGMLIDKDASVRREAANAIAQALIRSKGVDVVPASEVLLSRLASESDSATQLAMREALARLHYSSQNAETAVLNVLIQHPEDAVVVLRNDRTLKLSEEQRTILHRQAWPDDPRNPPSPAAIEALGIIGDTDSALVNWAVLWRCPNSIEPTCGWEVRYEAVQRMDAANPLFEPSLNIARHDAAYQVRMAALRKYGAAIPRTRDCRRIVESIAEAQEMTVVKLDAISRLTPGCERPENIAAIIGDLASGLSNELPVGQWHLGMPALEVLSKIDPDKAKQIMTDVAVTSDVWQVRAAAARVATTLRDEAMLVRLADDRHPNVQTAALTGLASLKSARTREFALKALDAKDYQLIRQAGLALQGTKEIDATALPIFQTLDRLTKDGKDTSRDPRIALMTRLKEFAPLDSTGTSPLLQWRDELKKYLSDFDPAVASAAADILGIINGTRPDPTPTRRPPQQPTEQELRTLPTGAAIFFEDGSRICMTLRKDDAPLTVARFVKLANAHYYDNLTFHRLVPLFVAQGLSPGANEYTGDARFMRDELGLAHHGRGAIGISTRGRDTGDAQIFFDLIAQPRLDHDYTVFATVLSPPMGECAGSLERMDRILDADKVVNVTIRR